MGRLTGSSTAPIVVAHVVHDLRMGGAERRLLRVAAGLEPSRFRSLVICLDRAGPLADEARAFGVEPVVIGRASRFDITGVLRLARVLRREDVDIVHGWMWLPSVFGVLAGVLAGVRVRIASEGAAVATRDPWRARRMAVVDRLLAPLVHAWVANSRAVAASLRSRGVRENKITVIPNGVASPPPLDAVQREHIRTELGASPGDALIGVVARLDPEFKDHETVVRAIAELVAEGRPVDLAVIGDGPARPALEELVEDLGLEAHVTFAGFRPDSAHVLGALDVSVLLSYSEGFSAVILESMAAGVPLVATAIDPNREALEDEVHGLLVPPHDLDATTAALRRLLDDRRFAERLGEAARARALDHFSPEAEVSATAELYGRLLVRAS